LSSLRRLSIKYREISKNYSIPPPPPRNSPEE
jgi:hypothetical protein